MPTRQPERPIVLDWVHTEYHCHDTATGKKVSSISYFYFLLCTSQRIELTGSRHSAACSKSCKVRCIRGRRSAAAAKPDLPGAVPNEKRAHEPHETRKLVETYASRGRQLRQLLRMYYVVICPPTIKTGKLVVTPPNVLHRPFFLCVSNQGISLVSP